MLPDVLLAARLCWCGGTIIRMSSLEELLRERLNGIEQSSDVASRDQRHLDASTDERAYW